MCFAWVQEAIKYQQRMKAPKLSVEHLNMALGQRDEEVCFVLLLEDDAIVLGARGLIELVVGNDSLFTASRARQISVMAIKA